MKAFCETISYSHTGFFSGLVLDYLEQKQTLREFYTHTPDLAGIKASIAARKQFPQDKTLLHDALITQYEEIGLSGKVKSNIALLKQDNTFTITTAHQPNIFTGPLYFIYKILHAIKLAEHLKDKIPECEFVPVYYMGSEDADLDELGHIFLNGDKVEWQTDQLGAVGRMHTNGLEKILNRLTGEFGHLPFADNMLSLCREAYASGKNIQESTLHLVHELFKSFGLVVLIPDNAVLKKSFHKIVKRELTERFSSSIVKETADKLGEHYKVQASGRAINLFYLSDDGSRDRIEVSPSVAGTMVIAEKKKQIENFTVVGKDLNFTKEEILEELEQHPERFSGNVILRGVFQETILPNIVFIGGGGELAYWMELKNVFKAAEVPYPVLLLRNSFLLVPSKYGQLQKKLGINIEELFLKEPALLKQWAIKHSAISLETKTAQDEVYKIYEKLQEQASLIDPTLKPHIAALHTKTLKGLAALEIKFVRAEKRKEGDAMNQIHKLLEALFPNGNLQERIDNFMPLYAAFGTDILHLLYQYSQPLPESFSVLYLND